ncbi:MAG: sigma-70 family RNA polymerase sigma factor [Chloroflexota bacterium]
MDEREWLADRFEEHRAHLRAAAYRLLGSPSEAEDAVQDAWLRLSRADRSDLENLGGWLTTVVARVCLNMLQARKSRREEPLDVHLPEPIVSEAEGTDPEHEVLLADAVGPALLVVLDTLAPAERLAFVLHDVFAVSFEEVAAIVDRSPAAARQLASRARRRVRGADTMPDADLSRRRTLVDAFLAAARGGNFQALLALLDPDVVIRADPAAVQLGAAQEMRGATEVAATYSRLRARTARPALVDGVAGAVFAPGGQPRVVFSFTIAGGKIVAIDLIADPVRISRLDLAILKRTPIPTCSEEENLS